jgi:hypothetical protein
MAKLALKRVAVAAEIEDRVTGRAKVYVENKTLDVPAPRLHIHFVDKVDVAMQTEIPHHEPPQLEGEHHETDK